jgi:hypothetical protein
MKECQDTCVELAGEKWEHFSSCKYFVHTANGSAVVCLKSLVDLAETYGRGLGTSSIDVTSV